MTLGEYPPLTVTSTPWAPPRSSARRDSFGPKKNHPTPAAEQHTPGRNRDLGDVHRRSPSFLVPQGPRSFSDLRVSRIVGIALRYDVGQEPMPARSTGIVQRRMRDASDDEEG